MDYQWLVYYTDENGNQFVTEVKAPHASVACYEACFLTVDQITKVERKPTLVQQ